MAFWADTSNLEPNRQFRWKIEITSNADTSNVLTYMAKKCDLPKAKIGSVQHKYINHFFNYPGRLEWEDINVTLVSNKQSSDALWTILRNAGYTWPSNNNEPVFLSTISKNKFVNSAALGGFKIHYLSPEGTSEEHWELRNAFFTSVQFGTLDYSSEEMVDIQCTIKYDTVL